MKAGEPADSNTHSRSSEIRQRLSSLSAEQIRVLTGQILKSGGSVALQSDPRPTYRYSLEPIRPGGEKPPLFLVHPAGGGIKAYHELAKYLDAEQPVYAFQNHVFGTYDANPFLSIEEMAAHYVDALRKTKPPTSCFLGGWSMGGIVAFEMARKLSDMAEAPQKVIMFDSSARVTVSFDEEQRRARHPEDLMMIGTAIALADGKLFQFSKDHLQDLSLEDQFAHFSRALRAQRIVSDDLDDRALRALLTAFDNSDRAMAGYEPRIYPGKVVVLRASELTQSMMEAANELCNDPSFGWQAFCSQPVTVRFLPGDHMRIMTPPAIRFLAQTLQSCMDGG